MLSVILVCTAVVIGYRYLRWHFSLFQRLNIPGPSPNCVTGNLTTIIRRGHLESMISWKKEYGRVFGYFEGWTPVIAVSDPDILKDVLVKDFNNFRSRKPFPLAPRKALGLFLENGDQWKKSRTSLTPAFSSAKMRHMFTTIKDSVDILVDNTDDACRRDEPSDVYSLYQCLTLDVIGRCAFGLQTNAQTDKDDPFLNNIRKLFDTLSKTVIQPLVMIVPLLSYFVFGLKNIVFLFGMNPVVWLRNQMKDVIQIRKSMGTEGKASDLVDLMIFPNNTSSTTTTTSGDSEEASDKPAPPKKIVYQMTDREVVAQSMTFLLAGYETTSAALAFLTHVLANNAHVQERLCEEVDEVLRGKEVTYEAVNKMPYFDMVIDEVCRMYPTACMIVTRRAAETRVLKGFTIPANMNIQANVWALHQDEEFWEEPDKFIPERFSAENKPKILPYSFLPFGAGPRSCIGQRFAILEIKVAIARILQNFTFSKCLQSEEKLTLVARGAVVPQNGVNLRIHRRHSI